LAFDQHLLKVFRTGSPDEFEDVYEPGGRQCEVRLVPERGPAGEIESVLLIIRDITERKQAERLRQECRRFVEWAGIPCDFAAGYGLSSFGAEVDTALFRIAQEALTNVVRHASASRVAVSLGWRKGAALLQVEDDGRGIPAGQESTGLGLLGMRERAERLGGELAVKPLTRGGTMVEARIPSDGLISRKDGAS
jgi:glucose-6-phosphate-specific signal transduction histidine kinase